MRASRTLTVVAWWVALGLPGLAMMIVHAADLVTYGQVLHWTGQGSVLLLALVLSATPFRRAWPELAFTRILLRARRWLGVASFAYAALHTAFYLERKWGSGLILHEGTELDLATGWVAFGVFLVLAATSNDRSVRALGGRWRQVHWWIYVASALTLAHWVLSTVNVTAAVVSAMLVLVIQGLRRVPRRAKSNGRS